MGGRHVRQQANADVPAAAARSSRSSSGSARHRAGRSRYVRAQRSVESRTSANAHTRSDDVCKDAILTGQRFVKPSFNRADGSSSSRRCRLTNCEARRWRSGWIRLAAP